MRALLATSVLTVLLVASAAHAQSNAIPQLKQRHAERYMEQALQREFPFYRYSTESTVKCSDRHSRIRVGCKTIYFFAGDVDFKGHGKIWYSLSDSGRRIRWNYAFRIKETDYYCLNTGGSNCVKTHVVK